MKNLLYEVLDIEDISTISRRRLAAKVVLNENRKLEEMESILMEIVDIVKYKQVFKSESSKSRWMDKPTEVVYLNITYSSYAVSRGIYWLRAQWLHPSIGTISTPLPISKNKFSNGIYYELNNSYDMIINFEKENMLSKFEALQRATEVVDEIEKLVTDISSIKDELNCKINFEDILILLSPLNKRANVLMDKIDFLYPEELLELDKSHNELQALLGEMFLILSKGVKSYGDSVATIQWVNRVLPQLEIAVINLKEDLKQFA